MPHPLPASRPVDGRRLIQGRADPGQGRQIDHRVEAEFLPYVRPDHQRAEQFFYDYCSRKEINHKHAYELQEEKYITDNASLEKLKADWLSLNWVHENGLFDQFRLDLKNSRLTVPRLYHLLFALENVWNASYSELTGQTLTLPASFLNWREVEDWLTDVYQKTNLFSSSTRYSREVTQNILAVKTYIDGHCGEQR